MSTIIRNLGIDLGSSTTTVVGYTADGKEALLFRDTLKGTDCFETALATKQIPSDTAEEDIPSLAAQLLGNGDSGDVFFIGHAGSFCYDKLKEGLLTEPDTDRSRAYLRAYLRYILEAIAESGIYDFSQVENICFGYPAYDHASSTSSYITTISNILTDIFARSDGNPINLFSAPEPLLAATAYLHTHKSEMEDGQRLLVVDCGGSSVDMALVKVVKEEKHIYPEEIAPSVSIDGAKSFSLGKSITAYILELIYEKYAVEGLAPSYSQEAEAAKCAFFTAYENDPHHTEEMSIGQLGRPLFLSYGKHRLAEDEIDIATEIGTDRSFQTVAGIVCNYLTDLKTKEGLLTDGHTLNAILITGGAGRMLPLREAIVDNVCAKFPKFTGTVLLTDGPHEDSHLMRTADTKEPVALSADTAVAFGAAILARSPYLTVTDRDPRRDPIAKGRKEFERAKALLDGLEEARDKIEERLAEWVDRLSAADNGGKEFRVTPGDLTALLQETLPKITMTDEDTEEGRK